MSPDYNSQMHVALGGSWQRAGSRLMRQISMPAQSRVLDAGCGTGELTLVLARHVPEGHVVGIDADPACIRQATLSAEEAGVTNVSFRQGDLLASLGDREYDFAFCNSTLHLLADAKTALHNLVTSLREGGRLAIQLPAHDTSDEVHEALSEALRFVEGEELLRLWNGPFMPRSQELYTVLQELGLEDVRVVEELEPLSFRSSEDASAYFEKLLLGPYLRQLPEARQEDFLRAFGEAFPLQSGLPNCTLTRLYAHGTRGAVDGEPASPSTSAPTSP